MTKRVAAASALALGAIALTCRFVLSIDDKVLVDAGSGGASGSGGAGGCLGSTATLGCLSTTSSPASSSSGPPATTGCADATREGFLDGTAFPTIAACAASWSTQSMRTPPTGAACGNDLGPCATPADACAPGWHVCLLHGYPGDLTARISADDCAPTTTTVPARFLAASDQQGGHPCGPPLPCGNDNGWSIAVCCGQPCLTSQSSCVFPNNRTPFGATTCGAAAVNAPDGVLCCMDPEIMN